MSEKETCKSCLEEAEDTLDHAESAIDMLTDLLGVATEGLSRERLEEHLRKAWILTEATDRYVRQIREQLRLVHSRPAE